MGKLVEALSSPANKAAVVADCVRIIDEEVADKGGISGLAVKAVYKTVKGLRADFIQRAVEGLLPEFAQKLEPFWEQKQKDAPNEATERWLKARSSQVADALLEVTDARAKRSDKGVVRSAYEKLRPTGKKNVEEAMPRIARLIDKHVK